jgi:hypothetical protein
MDLAEAKLIADIVGTADGGCPGCVDGLVDQLNDAFPGLRWSRTKEDRILQPDWTDDPDFAQVVGCVVDVEIAV